MHLAVFGLTITSSWGNGHATLWRALAGALGDGGHRITFFERDTAYYAAHRDLATLPGHQIVLYREWDEVVDRARHELAAADVAMITSYCPDGRAAAALVLDSAAGLRVFYDMDTPVTLAQLSAGEAVPYLPENGLGDFDLVLSFTGGHALDALRERLGARMVTALYGSVNAALYRPGSASSVYAADLSHLGTYAADRHAALERLLLEPARRRPDLRFLIGGSLYPQDFTWLPNLFYVPHVWPPEHPAFYASSRFTLNVTRGAMAAMGYCPSGRLFEAAACGATILTDWWEGLDEFFEPGREVLVCRDTGDVLEALALDERERRRIGDAARARALACHTALNRVIELEQALEAARAGLAA